MVDMLNTHQKLRVTKCQGFRLLWVVGFLSYIACHAHHAVAGGMTSFGWPYAKSCDRIMSLFRFNQGITIRSGENSFQTGVSTYLLELLSSPEFAGKQRSLNWCWAASIQMVLNYHGLHATQEGVVMRRFGQLIDRPGSELDMIDSLTGFAFYRDGRAARAEASSERPGDRELIEDLALGNPLIIGLKMPGLSVGHAFVVTSANYHYLPDGTPVIESLTLRDPWPGNPSRSTLSMDDINERLISMIRLRVIPL